MAEDTCDDLPLQKKPKRSHPPVRTPGPRIDFAVMDMSSSSRDRTEAISSVNKHPHTKTRVTFFDAASDSDDEPLTKRSRVESRAKKPLTAFCIRKNRSDPAVSVANAYNNALAQNSQRIPNVARRLLSSTAPPLARKPNIRRAPEPATPTPSSRASFSSEGLHTARSGVPSSTIPPLPLPARRQIKRKAPEPLVPPPGPPASSSSEGPHTARRGVASSATPPLPLPSRKPTKRRVEPVAQAPLPLAPSSFEGAHLDLAKEVAELRHFVAEEGALMRTILTQQGHLQAPSFVNPAMVPAIPQANAIDSAYNQFVASVQQAPLRTSGNESVGQILADFVCGVLSGLQSPPRNQIAFRGSRNRGRGRGGAFFAGSPRRSTVAFPQEYRPHRWRSFSGPARPMNDEEESRRHHAETERVWIPGPHANSEHWDPAEQANRQYANQADARRDAHAGQWSTRFAPNLTENLTGVEHRYHDAVPSMRWETSSDSASGTLVGVDPPSVQPDSGRATSSRSGGVRQRTASQDLRNGNPRGEGSSAPREKFFATLDRSTSPDAWEDRYVQDNT
ncbi:hypothetical protein B0H10DRAFT_2213548 [Mycena sp. CBHHK59/15]|nr:hypothetical protein B0H10DRAFT_2213548 [Mycena sp. CBHHK59/15]